MHNGTKYEYHVAFLQVSDGMRSDLNPTVFSNIRGTPNVVSRQVDVFPFQLGKIGEEAVGNMFSLA